MSELENSLLEDSVSLLEDDSESILEKDISEMDFIKTVSKYEDEWNPRCLFNGFNTKVIIKDPESGCHIEKYNTIERLKKRLNKDVGEEDEDWILEENPVNGNDELYLRNGDIILMWVIKAADQIKTIIAEVHNHTEE